MTTRLYYADCMLREFDATVVACRPLPEGGAEVLLDRTAFYPTSGGQPFDTGELGGAAVSGVVDRDDGEIVHVVSAPLEPGKPVHGTIDWPRRFDHMQQHTGQHILSATFERELAARTVSFHLGADASTIDLDRDVSGAGMDAVEHSANAIVWDDRRIGIRTVGEAEAAALPLRKEPARRGDLRLVEVPGCDLSACGGTHVPSTGAVGVIVVSGWERWKGGVRVTFLCGGRAARSHARMRDLLQSATRLLSTGAPEVPGAIERLLADAGKQGKTIEELRGALAGYRAAELRAGAETIGDLRVVFAHQPDLDAASARSLAAAVVAERGLVAVIAGAGAPTPLVVARSTGVSFDAAALLKELIASLGGRGGGRPEQAQGGLTAPPERVLAAARERLAAPR